MSFKCLVCGSSCAREDEITCAWCGYCAIDKTDRLEIIREFAGSGLLANGDHRKQWYLERVFYAAGGDLEALDYEEGVVP